jgi:hypothetical protein
MRAFVGSHGVPVWKNFQDLTDDQREQDVDEVDNGSSIVLGL